MRWQYEVGLFQRASIGAHNQRLRNRRGRNQVLIPIACADRKQENESGAEEKRGLTIEVHKRNVMH